MSSNPLKRILIVEDSNISSFIVKKLIRASGLFEEPALREDGGTALRFLEHAHQMSKFPDVIILDLQMPGMDGYEFLDWYDQQFFDAYPDTKIFIFSVESSNKAQQKVLKYRGVDSMIPKRQDGTFLTTLVQRLNN